MNKSDQEFQFKACIDQFLAKIILRLFKCLPVVVYHLLKTKTLRLYFTFLYPSVVSYYNGRTYNPQPLVQKV